MYFFQNRGKFVKNLSNSGRISMIGTGRRMCQKIFPKCVTKCFMAIVPAV